MHNGIAPNKPRPIRRSVRKYSAGTTAASPLIFPGFSSDIKIKGEIQSSAQDFLLDNISLLSRRVEIDPNADNLLDCFAETFARFWESLEPGDMPQSMRGSAIIEFDAVFVHDNLYHDRLYDSRLPGLLIECDHAIRICECGKTMQALRDISGSLPGYIIHALNQSPINIYTADDYIHYCEERAQWDDPGNDPSEYTDEQEQEIMTFDPARIRREWPEWTRGKNITPRNIPEQIAQWCESLKRNAAEFRKFTDIVDDLRYFEDPPTCFLCMSEDDPVSDAIRDQYINSWSDDEALCSPLLLRWGDNIDRFADCLKYYLAAASDTGKILNFLNPSITKKL